MAQTQETESDNVTLSKDVTVCLGFNLLMIINDNRD